MAARSGRGSEATVGVGTATGVGGGKTFTWLFTGGTGRGTWLGKTGLWYTVTMTPLWFSKVNACGVSSGVPT